MRSAMRVHSLKTDPDPFDAILDGRKRFEHRKDDRGGFQAGDVLHLREYNHWGRYTGRSVCAHVTYVLTGEYGIPKGYAVMSLELEDEQVKAVAGLREKAAKPE